MSIPKRHHYVPQFLLNHFTDEEGWLFWCHRKQPDMIRPARPGELFHQRHLYSTVSSTGVREHSTETALSLLESEAKGVVASIIDAARQNREPSLSPNQMRIWYAFFLTQWRRTPDTQQATTTDEQALQMVRGIIDELLIAVPSRRFEIEQFATPEAMARTIRNSRTDTLRQVSPEVVSVLIRRGISILHITKPNKRFIIGSRPVVKLTVPGRTDLNDPAVEMWLPVASDTAVGVGRGDGGISLHFLEDSRPVRQLNMATAKQSSIIAAASAKLVQSVASSR